MVKNSCRDLFLFVTGVTLIYRIVFALIELGF